MSIPNRKLLNGYDLVYKQDHHGKKPSCNKSVWKVSEDEEEQLANDILANKLQRQVSDYKEYGYDVKRNNNKLKILGADVVNDHLKLSRFEYESSSKTCHGYPINHQARNSDKPPETILNQLENKGLLTKQDLKNISKGRPL